MFRKAGEDAGKNESASFRPGHRRRCAAAYIAIAVFALAGCHAASTSSVPLLRESSVVTVAGDTPADFAANLSAARAAGKTVRIVEVNTGSGSDLYSAYAQVVRTDHALLVRVYGRIHVYDAGKAQVMFPPGTAIDMNAIPRVAAPTVDRALMTKTALGAAPSMRRVLCARCDMVLLRPQGVEQSPTLWADKKDSWQTAPDYGYWAPGSDTKPRPAGRNTETLVHEPCYLGYQCCPNGVAGVYNNCYYPGGGGGPVYGFGGNGCAYSYCGPTNFGGPPPKAKWYLTAESACAAQGGRWGDVWGPQPEFYCSHVTDPTTNIVGGLALTSWCWINITLLPHAQLPIMVSIVGPTITPSDSSYNRGVRANVYTCTWYGTGN